MAAAHCTTKGIQNGNSEWGRSSLLTLVMRERLPVIAARFRRVFLRQVSRDPLWRGRYQGGQAISAWGNTPTLPPPRPLLEFELCSYVAFGLLTRLRTRLRRGG